MWEIAERGSHPGLTHQRCCGCPHPSLPLWQWVLQDLFLPAPSIATSPVYYIQGIETVGPMSLCCMSETMKAALSRGLSIVQGRAIKLISWKAHFQGRKRQVQFSFINNNNKAKSQHDSISQPFFTPRSWKFRLGVLTLRRVGSEPNSCPWTCVPWNGSSHPRWHHMPETSGVLRSRGPKMKSPYS